MRKENSPIPLYTEERIRQLEDIAIKYGIKHETLMQRAGKSALEFILSFWPKTQSIIIFCGSGNNGGDGYTLAYLAHEQKKHIKVRFLGNLESLKGETLNALQKCQKKGINIKPFQPQEVLEADLFVDALLGIGLQGEVREPCKKIIDYINHKQMPVLALDIPSGIDANTGSVRGTAVRASCTLSFIGIKQGLFLGDALDHAGQVFCKDLDIPQKLFDQVQPTAWGSQYQDYIQYLIPRSKTAHKGLFGHVLIIGGDYGMNGAPLLTALGAIRSGAGLVTVATRVEHAAMMTIKQPELMSRGIKHFRDLKPLLDKATVIVIGPGLGQSRWAKKLYKIIFASQLPLIIDADALNLLAHRPLSRKNWILTPHPGEAARLLNMTTQQIKQDKIKTSFSLQKQYGGTCVLKGAGAIILDDSQIPSICIDGNPGMASAGMGDLLSGIIAGLIAQGIPASTAAKMGVCLHAKAGDLAAHDGERGLLATDLLPFLRHLINIKTGKRDMKN